MLIVKDSGSSGSRPGVLAGALSGASRVGNKINVLPLGGDSDSEEEEEEGQVHLTLV